MEQSSACVFRANIHESTTSILKRTLCVRVAFGGWGLRRAGFESGRFFGVFMEGGGVLEQSTTILTVRGRRVNRVKRFMANPKLCSFKKFAHLSSWQRATWPI